MQTQCYIEKLHGTLIKAGALVMANWLIIL